MSLVDPFHRSLCPYCFNRFYLGWTDIMSSNTTGKKVKSAPTTDFERMLARFWIEPLNGPLYTSERAARQCPNCGNLLPYNMEYMDNHIIALVGAGESSKTHYIASLVKQIEQDGALSHVGSTEFAPLSQEIEQRYTHDLYEPLFQRNEQLKLSLPQKLYMPFIYTMVFKNGRRVNLILYDAPGEDLIDQTQLTTVTRYVLNASAIIFLVDPMGVPSLLSKLPPFLQPEVPRPLVDSFRILQSMISLIRRQKNILPGTILDLPIAITLAKSDVLRFVVNSQSTFLRDADYRDGFNLNDYQMVNDEIKELIERESPSLYQATQAFSEVSFCAVSATGGPANNGKYKIVRPRRCPDPLLWILWKMGFIQPKS